MTHVLVVDDDPSFGEATVDRLLRRRLRGHGQVHWRSAGPSPLGGVRSRGDRRSNAGDRPDLPLLVVTAFGSLETAIAASFRPVAFTRALLERPQ
jgi:hypothetical protein